MELWSLVIALFLMSVASARNIEEYKNRNFSVLSNSNKGPDSEVGFSDEVHLLYKIYEDCNKDSLLTCLKLQLVMGLDRAICFSSDMQIMEGVILVQNNDLIHKPNTSYKSQKEIEMDLPRSAEEKNAKLDTMISDRIQTLFQTRIFKVHDPNVENRKSSTWEGRGKKDKKNSGAFIMIPLLLSGTFIPIAYGALAFLAGKALIVSKLALVLASIIGIKKLLSSNNLKESQHEVVVSSGHNGGSGWGRDIDLAYSSYNPDISINDKYP